MNEEQGRWWSSSHTHISPLSHTYKEREPLLWGPLIMRNNALSGLRHASSYLQFCGRRSGLAVRLFFHFLSLADVVGCHSTIHAMTILSCGHLWNDRSCQESFKIFDLWPCLTAQREKGLALFLQGWFSLLFPAANWPTLPVDDTRPAKHYLLLFIFFSCTTITKNKKTKLHIRPGV